MPDEVKVEVRGIKEVSAALKRVGDDLPKELQAEFRAIAQRIVDEAASKVPSQSGRAAGSIKPRASKKGAGVAAGGARVPYYGWLDFGGHRPRDNAVSRPFIRQGRYLYPTVEEHREDIGAAALEAVEKVARKGGFEVRDG